ncbi:MAG: methionyl-tRNA formyltransferase [bacterium]
MQIVFMGSGSIACPSLKALMASRDDAVVGVVVRPERPKGRGLKVGVCPVAETAGARTRILALENVNTPGSIEQLRALNPDLLVIVAFGQILKTPVLSLAPHGCVNLHPSLLPKYRGAAPAQWAVANGDRVSGVTTMFLNERMDAGDIILQKESPVLDSDTGGSLLDRLAAEGAALLTETLALIRAGSVRRIPQDDSIASLAPMLKKSDGLIDWTMPAARIHNRVRAFNPWPGSFCSAPGGGGAILKVLGTAVEEGKGLPPGAVIEWRGLGPLVQAGDKAVRLVTVQPENRKAMSGGAYVCGHPAAERL